MAHRIPLCHRISRCCVRGGHKTYIAGLVFFPCEEFPPPVPLAGVELGDTVVFVALYPCRVANMYPGPVGLLPLLMVLLIAENDSLRSCALKSP